MDKKLSWLCDNYRRLQKNENYSDQILRQTANERRFAYFSDKTFYKEDVLKELKCLLDYYEYGLFNYYYAQKNPEKLINAIKVSHYSIKNAVDKKTVDKETYILAVESVLDRLKLIFSTIKRNPHSYNGNKFGPTKKAIKEIEELLEELNMPTSRRRKVEKVEELSDD